MKRVLFFLFCLSILLSSFAKDVYVPRDGDLLFVVDSSSRFSKAITDATAWGDSLKYSHVAIVALENGEPYVLEASSRRGVVRTEWDDFMGTPGSDGEKIKVVIMRLKIDFPIAQVIARAKSHLGKAYDWSFQPDNDKFYCSELVYDCYRNADGTPIFTAKPMNFRDSNGNVPAYWVDLFKKLGEPIPEGVYGTNPGEMSKASIMIRVYP